MQVNSYQPYAYSASQTVQPQQLPVSQIPRGQSASTTVSALYEDQFAPSSQYTQYRSTDNVVYGQGKNLGLRIIEKNLGLKAGYIEADFIDKTPETPLDIEGLDFNLYVKSGEVHVSDVDATLTIQEILARKTTKVGKKNPIKDLRVVFDPNNQIRVEGKYKALGFLNVPFQVKGNVSVRSTGEIQYALGDTKVAGIKVNGMMKTFGMSLDSLLKLKDRSQGFYTEGNHLVVDLEKTITGLDAIGLHARVRGVRTHLGNLSLLVGDTPEDAQRAWTETHKQEPAYIKATAGHAYIDGFFAKNATVNIYDQTPDSPLGINTPFERSIMFKKGQVAITEPRFEEIIKEEIGAGGDLSKVSTTLNKDAARLKGTMFGFVPLKLDLAFSATPTGKLMLTANKPKVFGFVPLPSGFVQKKLQGMIKNGSPYGDGVALDGMKGIDLGHVNRVTHQDDFIIIESGN